MSCELCSLDSSVEMELWKCVGCTRTFHATCVGVPVKRGSLRKNEKKIDVQSYVIPCCSSCQVLVTLNFDLKLLIDQQAQLTEMINSNTEVTHRSAQQNNIQHKTIEHLDLLLTDIKKELVASSSSRNAISIKNHMTSLNDIAIQASNKSISSSFQAMASDISSNLRQLNDELNNLSTLTVELTNSAPSRNNPMLELDILSELKSLSANIMSKRSETPLTTTDSLDFEINSGWRLLGTRKVWRQDWTEYDARVSRRVSQQKMADKAKKRKKQNMARVNLGYKNCNNNGISFNNTNHSNFNTHTNNYNNNNNTQQNYHRQNGTYLLPPDRELLAAAKDRFSRPPARCEPMRLSANEQSSRPSLNYQPTIRFQRGDILNPYPEADRTHHYSPSWPSTGSGEPCCCRNPSFLRH